MKFTNPDNKSKKSMTSLMKSSKAASKEVKIKIEPGTEDLDDDGSAVMSEGGDTPPKPDGKGPAPGSREFAVLHAATKGVESPMKAMKAMVQKSKAAAEVKMFVFILFGDPDAGENDYTVAIIMAGDLYAVRDQIKSADKKEAEVNGVCIPMPENALPARFISGKFKKTLVNEASKGSKTLAKFIDDECECLWLIFAPKSDESGETSGGAASAAISAAVSLDEYALIWRHALQGKPVHFDQVKYTEYYIGVEELEFLQTMQSSPDPHFGKRSSSIRK